MRASPLLISWHNDNGPIYSAHFEPQGKGRLATAGGDNNVRLWMVEVDGEERKPTYLATLSKHTQAVNVVRWCPHDEILASAGDDGNVLLWTPTDGPRRLNAYGDDGMEEKETWIVRRMCRSTSGSEIYDLAWSPDGAFFIIGSMDNVARIFEAQTGNMVRQIAEHNHYVQGVAWDPLNEFLATQSSDRSVHIYKLRTNDGHFSLAQHGRMSRMDLPTRRPPSNSPAPDLGGRQQSDESNAYAVRSPLPSAPGTPVPLALPMNPPPPASHSRRSSFGNASPAIHRSASPAPPLPLPAVMASSSPNPAIGLGARNTNIYANETFTSFFRRLTFAPDGSLLFTPAGQYKSNHHPAKNGAKSATEITNTVYIYSRGGLNKPPVAHLPGHKKPSVAVRCSPIFYNLRLPSPTKQITVDTSSASEDIMPLPEPVFPSHIPSSSNKMEPPAAMTGAVLSSTTQTVSPKPHDANTSAISDGPPAVICLPYRIVYAVATQDAIFVYDTQQHTPLCVVSNLHFATFTDVTWSSDGLTLLMSSSDGFCSALSFSPGELGIIYQGSLHPRPHHPSVINTSTSPQSLQLTTPAGTSLPSMLKQPSSAGFAPPSPVTVTRPMSPTRSNSASSIATQSSFAQTPSGVVMTNPTPSIGNVPSLAVISSGPVTGHMPFASPTPPMTPLHVGGGAQSRSTSFTSTTKPAVSAKREGEEDHEIEEGKETKKRRIAPTLVDVEPALHS